MIRRRVLRIEPNRFTKICDGFFVCPPIEVDDAASVKVVCIIRVNLKRLIEIGNSLVEIA